MKDKRVRLLLALGLLALAPLLGGFLCFPLVPLPPSAVITPTPAAFFDPAVSASVASNAPGAQADIVLDLAVPAGSTLPIGATFEVPEGWSVAGDATVTDGSLVGSISGSMTVADPVYYDCGNGVPLSISLLEGTTNTAVKVSGADTDGDGTPQVVEDNDGDSLPDGVDKYPAFLNAVLPGTHAARYFGHTLAGGLSHLYVNVVVDELAPGGPYRVTPIVNDPTAPPDSATAQFCAPQSITLTLSGTSADNPATGPVEGGQAVYANPAAVGSYTFSADLVSEFDKDNDGVANGLDNCPGTPNAAQADADQDYVGNACEQDSEQNYDVDGDNVENGYDNCMFVSNAGQADSDFDDIGDACDAYPGIPDGPNYYLACNDSVGIGQGDPGPASCGQYVPTPPPTATPTPKDPDGDTDGDTIPNSSDPDDDSDGCTDVQELGLDQTLGGRRDPHSFWDFYDPNRDGSVSGLDFFAVLSRFGATQSPPPSKGEAFAQALAPPPPPPQYHASHDRTSPAPGADPWDTRAPDGAISGLDFFAVLAQFNHSCT